MKYYSYNICSFRPDGSVYDENVKTLSEADILKEHWSWWKEKMILKYGKEHFEATFSEKDCIDDWMVVNWAWETNEDRNNQTNSGSSRASSFV